MSVNHHEISGIQPTETLEAGKSSCPLPLLKIKKKLAQMSKGDVLQITGIHGTFTVDVKNWCERSNHFFLNEINNHLSSYTYIKKG